MRDTEGNEQMNLWIRREAGRLAPIPDDLGAAPTDPQPGAFSGGQRSGNPTAPPDGNDILRAAVKTLRGAPTEMDISQEMWARESYEKRQ